MWTDFNNPFTVAFRNELRKKFLYNLATSPQPHYLVKFECSTVQPYRIVVQFKSVQSRLFSVNIYRDVMILIICLCKFIYNFTARVVKISAISMHACFECALHLSIDACRWRIVQCCVKCLTDAVAIYCADVTSDDVNGTRKRHRLK